MTGTEFDKRRMQLFGLGRPDTDNRDTPTLYYTSGYCGRLWGYGTWTRDSYSEFVDGRGEYFKMGWDDAEGDIAVADAKNRLTSLLSTGSVV